MRTRRRRAATRDSLERPAGRRRAVLVIAGDVDPDATLVQVKQLFGDIEPRRLPARPEVNLRSVPDDLVRVSEGPTPQ